MSTLIQVEQIVKASGLQGLYKVLEITGECAQIIELNSIGLPAEVTIKVADLEQVNYVLVMHQTEHTEHIFEVENPDKLTGLEVSEICNTMRVSGILINGRYYKK